MSYFTYDHFGKKFSLNSKKVSLANIWLYFNFEYRYMIMNVHMSLQDNKDTQSHDTMNQSFLNF